ncbi:MAG: hypothetical protein QM490_02815 [Candidatus Gracilibacteria bacterium]
MALKPHSIEQIQTKSEFKRLFSDYPELLGKIPRVHTTIKKLKISREVLEMRGEQVDGVNHKVSYFEPGIIGTKKQTICFVNNNGNSYTPLFDKQNIVALLYYCDIDSAAEEIKRIIIISDYHWYVESIDGEKYGDNFSIVICEVANDDRKLIREMISEL